MSSLKIISRRTLSDAAGAYIAYTYADGHVTTDPPNRPISREDLQRQVRDTIAQQKATQSLTGERARYTKNQAQLLAPNSQQIARAEFDVINGGLVTAGVSNAVRNFTKFASTATATKDYLNEVVTTASLGGELVNPGIEFVPPYPADTEQAIVRENFAIERHPPELRRDTK